MPSKRDYTAERVAQTAIRRQILIRAMGGKCEYCPCNDPTKLEFHHKHEHGPREWKTHNTSRWTRQAIYEREFIEGKIELACGDCNKRLGPPPDPTDAPF